MFRLLPCVECVNCHAGVEFILPTDVIVADKFDASANSKTVPVDGIEDGWMVKSSPRAQRTLHTCFQEIPHNSQS